MGAKSFLAISQSSTVISRVNGIKNTYSAFIDEGNYPSIAHLTTEDTDEHNGLEVIVPVKDSDIDNFIAAAKSVFSFLQPPKVNIGSYALKTYETDHGFYAYNSTTESSYCVIGGVAYPITESSFKQSNHRELVKHGITLRMNIGDVSIAPSRESLSEDARTISILETRLDEVLASMKIEYQKKINELSSYFRARATVNDSKGIDKVGYSLVEDYNSRSLKEAVKVDCPIFWKESKLKTGQVNVLYKFSRKFMIMDAAYKNRMRHYFSDKPKHSELYIVIIKKEDIETIGLGPDDYTNVSEILPTKRLTCGRGTGVVGYIYRGSFAKKSERWAEVKDIPKGSVVLYVENKHPAMSDWSISRMYSVLRDTYNVPNLYSVTEKSIKKNKLDVACAYEFIKSRLKIKSEVVVLTQTNKRFIDLFDLKVKNTISERDQSSAIMIGIRIIADKEFEDKITELKKKYPILEAVDFQCLDENDYKIFKEFFNASTHTK